MAVRDLRDFLTIDVSVIITRFSPLKYRISLVFADKKYIIHETVAVNRHDAFREISLQSDCFDR